MTETTNYSLNVVEGSDLFNPLTQFNPNFTQIDSIMFDNEKAGVAEATELKSGTTHALIRDNTNRQIFVFTATSDYEAGDTFTVDGNIVTAKLPSGESLGAGAFVVNSTVLCSIVGSLLTVYTSKGGTTTATDSERLGGELPAYYATAEELMTTDAKADSAASVAQSANAISIQNQSAIQGLSGQLTSSGGTFYFDFQNGKYGYNTSPTRGADTFFPFKSGICKEIINAVVRANWAINLPYVYSGAEVSKDAIAFRDSGTEYLKFAWVTNNTLTIEAKKKCEVLYRTIANTYNTEDLAHTINEPIALEEGQIINVYQGSAAITFTCIVL